MGLLLTILGLFGWRYVSLPNDNVLCDLGVLGELNDNGLIGSLYPGSGELNGLLIILFIISLYFINFLILII